MGKKRVLLIYPPLDKNRITPPIKTILIGLGYIGAVLKQQGHIVEIFDGITATKERVYHKLINFKPDVVGISAMFTPYAEDVHKLAQMVKSMSNYAKVIVGGTHASTFPEECLKDHNIDIVIVGEGETAICEILESLESYQGLVQRPMVNNLDTLPFPAWDLLERDLALIKTETLKNKFIMRKPAIHLITSRGCPKQCYFCSVHLMWGRKWRARSAENVVSEIEWLKGKGYREFYFMDDNCSVDRKRINEICDLIISKGWDIRLACPTGIAIETLDEKTLKKMKRAGFYRLCFGIETGNQESQKIIGKNIDLEKAVKTIRIANRLGFWTSATFIVGFPHERLNEIHDTFNFIKHSQIDFPIIHLLCPQPKTRVNEIMREEGLINDATDINATYINGFKTRYFVNRDLHCIVSWMYESFLWYKLFSFHTYINLLRKIRNFEDVKYMMGLATIPLGMLGNAVRGTQLSVISARQGKEELKTV